MDTSDQGKRTRWNIGVIAGAVVIVGGGAALYPFDSKPAPKKAKPLEIISVNIPPPPPPLPPPPPKVEPPPPEEQKMIEQAPVAEEAPPDEAPSLDEPSEDLGTGIVGDGPNDFGLKHGSGSGGKGGKGGSGRRSGRFDKQAVGIQNTLLAALKRNEKTRRAVFSGEIKVWADPSGRLTRVQLVGSTGSPSADEALRQDLLGLQFPDVSGVPMPAHIRVNGRKPTP